MIRSLPVDLCQGIIQGKLPTFAAERHSGPTAIPGVGPFEG